MRNYLRTSGIIFGLVAIGHLLRLVFRWPLLLAGRPLPWVASLLVLIGSGAMAVWAYRLSSRTSI
jgi:hypothetical protein